jgi:hypothetical protein
VRLARLVAADEGEVVAAEGEGVEVGGVEVDARRGRTRRARPRGHGEELAGLGPQVAVAEADGGGEDVLGDGAAGGVAAGVELGAGGGEAAAGLGGGEGDGGVGGRGSARVRASRSAHSSGSGRARAAATACSTTSASAAAKTARSAASSSRRCCEAEHAAVHELGRLVAADVGGEAGVGVHGEPAGAVVDRGAREARRRCRGRRARPVAAKAACERARGASPQASARASGAPVHTSARVAAYGAEAGAERGRRTRPAAAMRPRRAAQLAVELGEQDRRARASGPAGSAASPRSIRRSRPLGSLGDGALRGVDDAAELGHLEGVDVLAGEGSVAVEAS